MATSRNTAPARLPALAASRAADPDVRRSLETIREWLEVRSGSRGDPLERAVTERDLQQSLLSIVSRLEALEGTSASSDSEAIAALESAVSSLRATVESLRSRLAQLAADTNEKVNDAQTQIDLAASGAYAPTVTLVASPSQLFTKSAAGALSPASITLTAEVENFTSPSYAWTVDGVAQANTGSTLTVNAFEPMAARVVRCDVVGPGGDTGFDVMTVYSLQEGSTALMAGLENENQTIPCDAAGNPTGPVNVTSKMIVVRGTVFLSSPEVTFSVVSSTGIENSGTTTGASANVSINSAGSISITRITLGQASATFRATVAGVSFDKKLTLNKSTDGAAAPLLTLMATGFAFAFADANATTTTSPTISFTAVRQNITGSVTFSAVAYNASNSPLGTVTLSNQTATTCDLTASAFTALGPTTVRYVRVSAQLGLLSDTMTIYRGDGGANAVQAVLTNESHTVPASADGTVQSYSGSGTNVRVFEGVNELQFDGVGSSNGRWALTRSVSTGSISPGGISQSGLQAAVGDHSGMSNLFDVATINYAISGRSASGGAFSQTKTQTIAKSRAGTNGVAFSVSASAMTFTYDGAGALKPAGQSISFIANRVGGTGTVTWTATAFNAAGSNIGTRHPNGATGDSVTMTEAQFAGGNSATAAVKVTATLGTLSDTVTIIKILDGANNVYGYLTNESVTVTADNLGNVTGDLTAASLGNFIVFKGLTDVTSSSSFSASASNCTVVGPASGTGQYYVTSMSADTATVTMYATNSGVTITKILTLAKSRQGDKGATGTKGDPGTVGATGGTAVTAYQIVTSTSLPSAPTVPSGAPIAGSPYTTNAWFTNPPTSDLASNQWLFMASGTLQGTTYTWTSPSFLATFKVGSLSALSADLGTVIAGDVTGAKFRTSNGTTRITINDTLSNVIQGFNNGNEIFRLDATNGRFWLNGNSNIFGAIYASQAGSAAAIEGVANGAGPGIWGQSNSSGPGIRAQGGGGTANGPALQLMAVTNLPVLTNGGVAYHTQHGLIVSNGEAWFKVPTVSI